jgi:hypothetical protein
MTCNFFKALKLYIKARNYYLNIFYMLLFAITACFFSGIRTIEFFLNNIGILKESLGPLGHMGHSLIIKF